MSCLVPFFLVFSFGLASGFSRIRVEYRQILAVKKVELVVYPLPFKGGNFAVGTVQVSVRIEKFVQVIV